MSETNYGLNHPLAVKLWSRKLFQESLKETWLYKFMSEDDDSAIQIKSELGKGPGDRLRYGLRTQLSGRGVEGDGTLEGNEESLTTYYDDLVINQLRHAVKSAGKMSEKRVPFSVREEARKGLTDWWADRIDTALFNQLAGNTGVSDTVYTGHNSTTAPSSNNWVYANGLTTEAQVASATTSNIFKLSMIDTLVEKANTISPMIRPLKINGEDKYLLFLHDYQVTDMRISTSTGQWLDIEKAAMAGMNSSKSPIYTGALGEYNGVIIHKSNRVPSGLTSGTRRAIFLGAQAGVVAFGQANSPNKATWVEEMFDYGNQLGVSAGMIWGAKKTVFNSQDFGTIVLTTYAVAH